ncbi:MAG: sterol desaturase family protein [Myxococcota bacterium]
MVDSLVRLGLFLALTGLAFAPLERLYGRHRSPRADRATDLWFATAGRMLVQLGLIVIVGTALFALDEVALDTPLWAFIDHRGLRMAIEIGTGLVLFELAGYAYHRAAHAVPALWRLHEVHHSSERMDWLASFRQHPLEIVLVTLVQNAPLVLLGLPLGSHAIVLLLLELNTVFVHADLRLSRGSWMRWIASPHFHHRHHQRDGAPVNFAAMFPWIDRLFGTYVPDETGPIGLPTPCPHGFVALLVRPFSLRTSRSSWPSSG